MAKEANKMVKVQGMHVAGKQHLAPGMVYEVTEELGKVLIEGKKAVKAKPDMVIGKEYKAPNGPINSDDITE